MSEQCHGEKCACAISTRHFWFEAFCAERDKLNAQPSLTPADLIALRDEWRVRANNTERNIQAGGYTELEEWRLRECIATRRADADQLDTLITRLSKKPSATDDK